MQEYLDVGNECNFRNVTNNKKKDDRNKLEINVNKLDWIGEAIGFVLYQQTRNRYLYKIGFQRTINPFA